MMKNAFYFILKALFILKIFKVCHDVFSLVEKQFDKKANGNFKIFDIIDWEPNNYNIHIAQYLKKQRLVNRILNKKSYKKCGEETIPRSFPKNHN